MVQVLAGAKKILAHRNCLSAFRINFRGFTGESYRCEPNSDLRKPPNKVNVDPDSGENSYDSVCGESGGSNIYVVYDHDKCLILAHQS